MGVMDKFIKYMTFNDEEEDYPEDDYLVDETEEEERPVVQKRNTKFVAVENEEETQPKRVAPASNKVTSIRQNTVTNTRKVTNNGMEVCVIRPTSVEDAREITDTLLSNRTVVLNLEGIDNEIAQRIIDFTSGSCFAINGNLQKISNFIFIITPESVDISGDFQDIFSGAFHSPINNHL